MKYETFFVGPMSACTYLVYGNDGKAVIIDAGGDSQRVISRANELGVELCAVLLTHGHFDHTFGAIEYKNAGIPIGISSSDEYMLTGHRDNLGTAFGLQSPPCTPDFTFRGGDEFAFGELKFTVISTPGHTVGSCCFLCDNVCFSGDTLFLESVGRTDFPTGSHGELINSIKKKLLTLPECVVVCPGHDEQTTIGHEKTFNPYLI